MGLGLDGRVEEISRLLVKAPLDDIHVDGHNWLRQRYREFVPLILPTALRAVEHGAPLDPTALGAFRRLAAECAAEHPRGDLSVVLRGAIPALRVFALVMQAFAQEPGARTLLAMSRASLIAHELSTCWVEAWWSRDSELASLSPVAENLTAEDIDLVPRTPDLEESDERMLALAAHGFSNQEISQETSYSKQAVAWRLGRLMKVWKAPNRTALVSFAFAKGWLRPRPARSRRRSRSRALEASDNE
ncbi:helix-turn-helix transcriptional regulator [Brachybacterium sacelli]|uniref:helix-turn-helix transcriptional regulator n=1 Tax=Brachybacterium sacelli TaxID=173364 RepID=UPI003612EC12